MRHFAEVTLTDENLIIAQLSAPSAAVNYLLWWLAATVVIVAISFAASAFVGWDRLFGGTVGVNMEAVDALLSAFVGAALALNAATKNTKVHVVFDRVTGRLVINNLPAKRLWEISSVRLSYRFAGPNARLIRLDLIYADGGSRRIFETTPLMRPAGISQTQPPCADFDPDESDSFHWTDYNGQDCGLDDCERELIQIASTISIYLDLPEPFLSAS